MPLNRPFVAALVLLAGSLLTSATNAETLAYPSADAPSFLIDYPDTWEMTPGEEVGDYTSLLGTAGTGLMFRTVTAGDVEQAIKDSVEYVVENYTDVTLSDPTELKQGDLPGFALSGEATDAESGRMRIAMAWFKLKDGTIGEIWFSAPVDDKNGIAEAGEVVDSFRAPD